MELTAEQKENIFENAREIVDNSIKDFGSFDDTYCINLENIILQRTFEELELTDFEKFANENLNSNIDLTQEFLAWLFNKNVYDKEYYENELYIRLKR